MNGDRRRAVGWCRGDGLGGDAESRPAQYNQTEEHARSFHVRSKLNPLVEKSHRLRIDLFFL
jgi:hypothetical protein